MSQTTLTVLRPAEVSPRLAAVLEHALQDRETEVITRPEDLPHLRDRRILIALQLDEAGQSDLLYRLLGILRRRPDFLSGSAAGIPSNLMQAVFGMAAALALAAALGRSRQVREWFPGF